MDRIFKKNMKKRLVTWKKAALNHDEIEKLTSTIDRQSYAAISRYGAADAIFRILKYYTLKNKFKGFKHIETISVRQTT